MAASPPGTGKSMLHGGDKLKSLTPISGVAYTPFRFERAPLVRGWRPGKTQLTTRAGKQRTICSWRNPRADFFVPKNARPSDSLLTVAQDRGHAIERVDREKAFR